MLQAHLPTSDGDDIAKLSGRIKSIYSLLKKQSNLQLITNEDRNHFFNARVLSILRAYKKTLTCLQMTKILHYIVHGEHHHELHPSYSANHEVIHEDALRHQDESTISRDHHVIDAIIAMFPKIIDTANIHILLLNTKRNSNIELVRRVGALRLFNVKRPFHQYSLLGRHVDDVKLMKLLMEICRDPSSGITLNVEDSYIQYEAKQRQLPTTKVFKRKEKCPWEVKYCKKTTTGISTTASATNANKVFFVKLSDKKSPFKNLSYFEPTTLTGSIKLESYYIVLSIGESTKIEIKGLAEWEKVREEAEKKKLLHEKKTMRRKVSPHGRGAKGNRRGSRLKKTNNEVKPSAPFKRKMKPPQFYNFNNSYWVGICD